MIVQRLKVGNVMITLEEGETFGNFVGPTMFFPGMQEGNVEYDELNRRVAAGVVTIEPYVDGTFITFGGGE